AREGRDGELVAEAHRQVLEAVHGEVEGAVEEASLELLGEEPLAADGTEVARQPVAAGDDGHQLHAQAGVGGLEVAGNVAGLRERQGAAPGSQAQQGAVAHQSLPSPSWKRSRASSRLAAPRSPAPRSRVEGWWRILRTRERVRRSRS